MRKEIISTDIETPDRQLARHRGLVPRLAPPGVRLVRPNGVYLGTGDFGFEVTGDSGEFDPFQYTKNGLLLVEDFARLPLPREAGAAGIGMAFRSSTARRDVGTWLSDHGVPGEGRGAFYGKVRDLLARQFWVREHLRVYEALSTLDAVRHPERWRPSAGFAISSSGGLVDFPWSGDLAKRRRLDAHKTLKKAIEDLQWRLNEPETWPQIRIEFSGTGLPLARADTTWGWVDPITPMALQLLEAALRLGEGRRLARTCPACGEVFLALDERRELYCNTRHRDRYLQRAHRARAATTA